MKYFIQKKHFPRALLPLHQEPLHTYLLETLSAPINIPVTPSLTPDSQTFTYGQGTINARVITTFLHKRKSPLTSPWSSLGYRDLSSYCLSPQIPGPQVQRSGEASICSPSMWYLVAAVHLGSVSMGVPRQKLLLWTVTPCSTNHIHRTSLEENKSPPAKLCCHLPMLSLSQQYADTSTPSAITIELFLDVPHSYSKSCLHQFLCLLSCIWGSNPSKIVQAYDSSGKGAGSEPWPGRYFPAPGGLCSLQLGLVMFLLWGVNFLKVSYPSDSSLLVVSLSPQQFWINIGHQQSSLLKAALLPATSKVWPTKRSLSSTFPC